MKCAIIYSEENGGIMTAVLKKGGRPLSYGIDKELFSGMTIARKNDIRIDKIKKIDAEIYNDYEEEMGL